MCVSVPAWPENPTLKRLECLVAGRGMNSVQIPFHLIDDDEFEALEVVIAAAECSSTSSKKYKLSEDPSFISYTDTGSAPLCESLTTAGSTAHKPACSTERAAANGQPTHYALHAASYTAHPLLQRPADVLDCWETSKRAAGNGQSCHISLHSATHNLHCPETLNRVAKNGESSHDSLHVAAENAACCSLQSSTEVIHKHHETGSSCQLPSNLADEKHPERFLGSATGAGDEAYQGEYREIDAKLLSEAAECLPCKMREKPCCLPSWQRNAITGGVGRLRSSGEARIRETLVDEEAQPAASSDFSEDVCVDNNRRPWGLAPSTCRVLPKWKVPYLQFKGRIKYNVTVLDAESAAHELLRQVKTMKGAVGNSVPLGFDTEWKAIFKRGAPRRKVSVLQLCLDSKNCHVFHVIHCGIPSSLRTMLEDPSVFKVGVGAYGDAAKLHADYGIKVKGVKDLSNMANMKLASSKSWSLAALAEEILGKQLDKNGKVRTGDWEVKRLSEAQLQYAATDAFASLYLFQVLMTFPDPQKKEVTPNVGEIHSNVCMPSST